MKNKKQKKITEMKRDCAVVWRWLQFNWMPPSDEDDLCFAQWNDVDASSIKCFGVEFGNNVLSNT